MTQNEHRFSSDFALIVRNAQGEIVHDSGLTEEQVQRHMDMMQAWDIYYQTGDDSMLRELGLLPDD